MIRILIADDEALVRGGLRMILEAQPDLQESRRGESHPPPLAEPCLNLSAYTAPIVQPPGLRPKRQ
jgi:DNA-binding NarL/FixJ family response regulator